MRMTAVLRALTGVALASASVLACGGAAAPADLSIDLPTSTPYPEPPTPTPYVPRDPQITREVVARLLPSPDATSAVIGISPGEWLLETSIGLLSDESEAFRLARSGITAGWMAAFRPGRTIYVSLYFHATLDDAERTYQHQRGIFPLPEERDTIADAVSMATLGPSPDIPTTTTFIFMRQQTVVAFVSMTHDEDRDVSAGLREFARLLALGIDEYVLSGGQ